VEYGHHYACKTNHEYQNINISTANTFITMGHQDVNQELSSETHHPGWYPKKVGRAPSQAPRSDEATDNKQAFVLASEAEFKS